MEAKRGVTMGLIGSEVTCWQLLDKKEGIKIILTICGKTFKNSLFCIAVGDAGKLRFGHVVV